MIFATNNAGKLKEIKSILSNFDIYSLKEKKINIEIIEDKDSFYENAKKKAIEIYSIAHEPVIADDSGLCIYALNNFPGVMTHRFMGENATDKDRNQFLIEQLIDCSNRNAFVECSLVYYDGKEIVCGEGILEGTIAKEMRGTNGFGFDSIFELPDGRTLAELTPEEKNQVSARYLAAINLKLKLKGRTDEYEK